MEVLLLRSDLPGTWIILPWFPKLSLVFAVMPAPMDMYFNSSYRGGLPRVILSVFNESLKMRVLTSKRRHLAA